MPVIKPVAWSTEQVEEYLRHIKIGECATYLDLSVVARTNVQQHRWCVTTALRHLEKQGILFRVEHNVGLWRLENSDAVVTERPVVRRKVRRITERRLRRLDGAARDMESFTPQAKSSYYEELSHLKLFRHLSQAQTLKEIEHMVADQSLAPGADIAVKLFVKRDQRADKSA